MANPFEVIAVRQISDVGRPAEFRRNYMNVAEGYNAITLEKPHGIWRGLTPHIIKAVLLNSGNIYSLIFSYDWPIRLDERKMLECFR